MPLYDYKCTKCGHIFEAMQKISEAPLKYCPVCKGPIKRLISPAGVIFKGSGFYATDSGKKSRTEEQKPKSEKKKVEGKPDASKSEKVGE